MRHNVQQFFFSLIFSYLLASKQAAGKCLNTSNVILNQIPHSIQGVDKPEQE